MTEIPLPDPFGNEGKALILKDNLGRVIYSGRKLINKSVNLHLSTQSGFNSDTYLLGSSINEIGAKVGSRYHLMFDVTKPFGGSGTPVISIRSGPNGDISDPVISTLTFQPQTNHNDSGVFEIWSIFTAGGISSQIKSVGQCRHNRTDKGLQNDSSITVKATSSIFDSTTGYIGVSINSGLGADWVIEIVQTEIDNI